MERKVRVYATSKNSGPGSSLSSNHVTLVYLGTSYEQAHEAVGAFGKYQKDEKDFPGHYLSIYSAVPKDVVNWEMVQYFAADGWWFSIVAFDLEDTRPIDSISPKGYVI